MKLALLVLSLLPSTAFAERFNGQALEGARISTGCFEATLQKMGSPAKGVVGLYFLRMAIKGTSSEPCAVNPFEFRIVDADGKQFDVRKVGKLGPKRRGESATILPGATKNCNLLFDPITLDRSRPAILYYGSSRLGEITK